MVEPPTSPGLPGAGADGSPPGLPPATASRRFGQYVLVALTLFASSLLVLVAQALVAYLFGAAAESDALFLARDIALSGTKLLLPAQAVGVLVPTFLSLRLARGDAAWDVLASLLWAMLLVATPLVILFVAIAPWLVALFAPGFEQAATDDATVLLRILAPTMLFVLAGLLAVAVLQAQERFGRAMLSNIAGAAATVAGIALLAPPYGIEGAGVGFLIGALVQAVTAWIMLAAEGMPVIRSPFKERDEVRKFADALKPLLWYMAATQVSAAVIRITASLLSTGVYTAVALARQLNIGLYTLIFAPINTVIFPALARHSAEGRGGELRTELGVSIRYVVYLVAPISVLLVVLCEPTTSFMFERGDFGPEDVHSTSIALAVYSAGLLLMGIVLMLEQAAFAEKRTRLVVGANLRLETCQVIGVPVFTVLLGVAGIPLAAGLASAVGSWWYWRGLRARGADAGALLSRRFLASVAMSAVALAAVSAGVGYAIDHVADPAPGTPQAIVIIPAALAGLFAYVGASRLLKLRELAVLVGLMGERLGRRSGAPA